MSFVNKAAIVGGGESGYSKKSGRTEIALACAAIKLALDDAGLTVADVDGIVRFEMDAIDDVALTQHLGLKNLRWMSETGYGGLAPTRRSSTPPWQSHPAWPRP